MVEILENIEFMTRRYLLLNSLAVIAKPKKQKWIVYELQDVIREWFKRHGRVVNNIETRHEFFLLCFNWLEEQKKNKKILAHQVWCNENNNTEDIIQLGNFEANIYIKSITTRNVKELYVIITDNGRVLEFKTI